ncbi:MAG: hypothetical protein EA361_14595 [Bacteroidetes bacterium]|nr:MAG: hypothetical protein EA361_14595 [Bacteroidota bacterium]
MGDNGITKNGLFILGWAVICILVQTTAKCQIAQDYLKGEWVPMFQHCRSEGSLIFSQTHMEGKSVSKTRMEFLLADVVNADGSKTLQVFNYEISFDDGENYNKVASSQGMVDTSVVHVHYITKDIMVHVSYKGGRRVHHHLERPVAYVRAGKFYTNKQDTPEIQKIIVLPEGFSGHAWIAHEQPDGEVEENDPMGRLVLRVPKSGYLLTQAAPMPVALALQGFEFFYENKYENREPMPKITYNCLNLLRGKWNEKQLTDEDVINLGFDLEKIYACAFTYNLPQRGTINTMFGRKIEGQVMYFQVDTLKNLIIHSNTWEGR